MKWLNRFPFRITSIFPADFEAGVVGMPAAKHNILKGHPLFDPAYDCVRLYPSFLGKIGGDVLTTVPAGQKRKWTFTCDQRLRLRKTCSRIWQQCLFWIRLTGGSWGSRAQRDMRITSGRLKANGTRIEDIQRRIYRTQ